MARAIALVGVGKIARDQHIPAIAADPRFRLAATASRNAQVDGVPAYAELAALLDQHPEIGCVSLCTPPQVRFADARRAVEAGRHVMLEKPPGATLGEVHALVAMAQARGLTLFATWHSRHAAAVAATRDWLRGRRLEAVEIVWKEDVRHWHPGQEWVWQPGGLGVFDPGINALSVLTAILPEPIRLIRAELAFPENRDTPVAADLAFAAPCGAPITAAFDWLEPGPPVWDVRLRTDDGEAVLSRGGARLTVGGTVQASGPDAEYPSLYARFAELIEAGASEVDLTPLNHVADAFTIGRRRQVAPFDW